jgi:hypothetical protein
LHRVFGSALDDDEDDEHGSYQQDISDEDSLTAEVVENENTSNLFSAATGMLLILAYCNVWKNALT